MIASVTAPPNTAQYAYAYGTVQLVEAGDSGVRGTLTLMQGHNYLYIMGTIFGLEQGLHGFHIHAVGDTSNNCKAAGGHFNPDEV